MRIEDLRMQLTKRVCAQCVFAGVLHSRTKLIKRIITRVGNSKFSQKETPFVTAYMRVRNRRKLEWAKIAGYKRLSRPLGKFSLTIIGQNWSQANRQVERLVKHE